MPSMTCLKGSNIASTPHITIAPDTALRVIPSIAHSGSAPRKVRKQEQQPDIAGNWTFSFLYSGNAENGNFSPKCDLRPLREKLLHGACIGAQEPGRSARHTQEQHTLNTVQRGALCYLY